MTRCTLSKGAMVLALSFGMGSFGRTDELTSPSANSRVGPGPEPRTSEIGIPPGHPPALNPAPVFAPGRAPENASKPAIPLFRLIEGPEETPLATVVSEAAPLPEDYGGPGFLNQPAYAGNGNRFWGSSELLLWGIKGANAPPLVTNGPLVFGSNPPVGGATLFGSNIDYNLRLGGRFTGGYWLDEDQTLGVEGSYFFVNGPSDNFSANSAGTGTTILGVPFINAVTGLPDRQVVSFPGITTGTVGIVSGSSFLGAQLNGIYNLYGGNNGVGNKAAFAGTGMPGYGMGRFGNPAGYRVDMIGGFMYLNLNENLAITENIAFLPSAPVPPFALGSRITTNDRFATTNNFYGGQLGGRAEVYSGAWFTNVTGAVALGATNQQVRINGSTVFTDSAGAQVTQRGGVFALPTNIGTYNRDQFAVAPQVTLNVGRQLTDNVRLFVGYSFLYLSNVVRPGDQINPVINPTQFPNQSGPGTLVGPARPAFTFHDSDFWAQGISFGLEIRR